MTLYSETKSIKGNLTVEGEDGVVTWTFEADGPGVLIRRGISRNSVTSGMEVTIRTAPMARYGYRANKVAIWGHSSGGHLAAFLHQSAPQGLRVREPALELLLDGSLSGPYFDQVVEFLRKHLQ